MKMKKVSMTTKYKFNIKQAVGVTYTYRFSIGDIENIAKETLKNNGIKNPDEIINKHRAEFAELKERLNKTDAKFESYKKETDKMVSNYWRERT